MGICIREAAPLQLWLKGKSGLVEPAMQPCRQQLTAKRRQGMRRTFWLPCLLVFCGRQQCFARELPQPVSKDMRVLTSKIKSAQTAGDLLDLVGQAVDKPIFNHIHASAAYVKLGAFQRKRKLFPSDAKSPVLGRLNRQVLGMLKKGKVDAQGLSNIFCAAGSMFVDAPAALEVVPPIAAQIPGKASDMGCQGLSNSLWAAAQLQNDASVSEVLPGLAKHILLKAGRMNPQDVSNILFASMRLADREPAIVEVVPEMVHVFWSQIERMNVQDLANGLEAIVFFAKHRLKCLGPLEQADIVKDAVARLKQLLPKLEGDDVRLGVPMILWACAKSETHDAKLLSDSADRFSSRKSISSLQRWELCALAWSFRRLDKTSQFQDRLGRLEAEITQRGLNEPEVLAERG